MDAVGLLAASVAVRVALLSYCLVVPGLALARWLGVRTASRLDATLIVVVLSLSSVSAAVTLLLLAHVYFRPVLVVLLLCPAAFLALSRRGLPRDPALPAAAEINRDNIDRAVLGAVALFLCVCLLDAVTTPAGSWDDLVTWGKWTADWGRRTASGDYAVGGFPQLVPRFLSVLYKLDGTWAQVLPLNAFVIHAFGVAAAAWLLLASIRLARLFDLPAWPLVLLTFGSLTFRVQIDARSVDVLLAAATMTLIALFLSHRKGEWLARRGAWTVLGAAMFACIFTWVTGVFALAAVACMAMAGERRESARHERRQLLLGLLVALVAVAPFVLEQGLAESRARQGQGRPEEVNITAGAMGRMLHADSSQAYHVEPLLVRAKTSALRFWNSYHVPEPLRWPLSAVLVVLFTAGAMRRDVRGLAVAVTLYTVVWFVWSSHDQRNLILMLPLIGAIAAAGAVRLASRLGHRLQVSLLAVALGMFVVLSGGALLRDALARGKTLLVGPAALRARLAMMPQGPTDRPPFFFPEYADVYRYVTTLAQRTGAHHVLATSPLFRFYENGVFTLFDWPEGLSMAGDVFAGHNGLRPNDAESWVLVKSPGWHRVWLREQLQDMPIPAPDGALPGVTATTNLMIETGPFDYDNGIVAWQVTTAGVPPESQVEAAFEASDLRSIDADLTSTTFDQEPSQLTTRYSGVLVLKPGIYTPSGVIRVGIRASGPPVRILAFKLSRRPGDGHRPRVE